MGRLIHTIWESLWDLLNRWKLQSSTGFAPLLAGAFSVRGMVFVLGKACFLTAIVLAERTGNNLRLAHQIKLPEIHIEATQENNTQKTKGDISDYAMIISRHVFGAPSNKAETNTQVATNLKLRLVGTSLSHGTPACAIVENGSNKEQDVFELNEMVFQQAKLVEVLPDKIKLERDGKIEVLALEDGDGSPSPSGGEEASGDEKTDFTVPEEELNAELANLPRLLSQARAVPYFRNGTSIGMRLFAIRAGSLYEKLGLKNGDIIKMVNKNNLSDPAQALKLFEQLKDDKSIVVKAERNGQDLDLNYTIR